jgi:hypothetical protein
MEILRQNNYNIVHLTDGKSIKKAVKLINDRHADGVNFNFIKNFPTNIDEIKLAKEIKYVQINDHGYDYSAINHLSYLEDLSVYTTDKTEINFSNYPFLKRTAIFWRSKANSLFNCTNLELLFIGKYTDPDLTKFEFLKNLKYLRINTGSVKTLKGIDKLQNLQTLLLMQTTKLEDLEGIDKLPHLQHLRIDNCRNIKNIDIVAKLKNITRLQIVGTTPSLTNVV